MQKDHDSIAATPRAKPKRARVQPKVRLPADLHKRLWRAAEKAGRSLNAEIALRLETSFKMEGLIEESDKRSAATQELFDQSMVLLRQAQELQQKIAKGGLLR